MIEFDSCAGLRSPYAMLVIAILCARVGEFPRLPAGGLGSQGLVGPVEHTKRRQGIGT